MCPGRAGRKGDRRAERARAVIMAKAAAKAHYPRQKTSYGRQSWFQSVLLREREEKMNMLVAISETVLLRWRESPDFNLLLVTFVKEVEGRETTWVVRGHAGMARGRDGHVRLPMSSVGGRQFFFFLAAA